MEVIILAEQFSDRLIKIIEPMATTTKPANITIEDFYFSGGQAMVRFFVDDEDGSEQMIPEEKVVKWLQENRPEWVVKFKYKDVATKRTELNERDLLSEFRDNKYLQKAFLKNYLGL